MLESMTCSSAWTGEVPWVLPIIRHPLIQRFVPEFHRQVTDRQKFAHFAKTSVAGRIDRGSSERKDMLTFFLESHRKKPDAYTQNDIISDAHTVGMFSNNRISLTW